MASTRNQLALSHDEAEWRHIWWDRVKRSQGANGGKDFTAGSFRLQTTENVIFSIRAGESDCY